MIVELTKIVGADRVSNKQEILEKYIGDFLPSLVVWPMSTDEVIEIVIWANKNSVALVPVSSGNPRCRGASFPKVENTVIIDLSKMNRIVRVDSKNKVVMVEPGVTYEELLRETEKNGLKLLMPFLPKGSKSVLTACLDREPITMPRFHWDVSDPLLCTETVFGSGDLFRTGSAAGPGTLEEQWASGQAQKNPQGPSQFDPFRLIQGSQGTIGISTWVSVKCEILPDEHRIYITGSDTLETFQEFVYTSLKRRLIDEIFILNNASLAAALRTDQKEIESLRNKLPEWILVTGISGHGVLAQKEFEYRIGDTMDIAKETNVVFEKHLAGIKPDEIKSIVNKPSTEPYWKLRLKGGCQEVLFISTLDRIPTFCSMFYDIADQVGFPKNQIAVYIQPTVQGINTHCGFDIYYNPEDETETKLMETLYQRGFEKLLATGAFFSRPYGKIVDAVFDRGSDVTVKGMHRVKAIFDLNNVLNPGTLCFKEVPK